MKKILGIAGAAAAALIGVTLWNLRRFMPCSIPLGENPQETEKKTLQIPWGEHLLYAELFLPKKQGNNLPTVVCSHGFNGSYRYFSNCSAPSLAAAGYAVLCFDFYAGSKNGKSGGSMTELSVFMEKDQLNAVIDWVKQQDFCDPHNLFLFGESQGGFVTAITGAEHSHDVKAMVLFYPAMCIQDDMRKQFPTWEDVPDEFPFMGTTLSKAYYEGLYDYDPYAVAGQFTGHVLIVHGDQDRIVSISYGQKLAACYENAEFVTLPGEDHGFSAEGKKKSTRLVYNFLEKQKSMESE